MSFIGSINAETRKWLGNNGAAFDGRQVYVGCSGNFTVEQLLSRYAPNLSEVIPLWLKKYEKS